MLISENSAIAPNPMLDIISALNGNSKSRELRTGVYEIGHFGSSHFLRGYNQYPKLSIGCYGVCDSVGQLLEKCPELHQEDRQFVVTVTPIRRADQESEGGWRWHKWGEYIGTKEPQCEYLRDEPEIEEVLVYQIYEKSN